MVRVKRLHEDMLKHHMETIAFPPKKKSFNVKHAVLHHVHDHPFIQLNRVEPGSNVFVPHPYSHQSARVEIEEKRVASEIAYNLSPELLEIPAHNTRNPNTLYLSLIIERGIPNVVLGEVSTAIFPTLGLKDANAYMLGPRRDSTTAGMRYVGIQPLIIQNTEEARTIGREQMRYFRITDEMLLEGFSSRYPISFGRKL